MTFNFVEKVFSIGGSDVPSPIQFYKRGFELTSNGASPSWQDIILSGNTALTLVNAKENGLNYLKLFGGTEQRNLPSKYTQVEYLESDGTQYINTGIVPTGAYTVIAKAKYNDLGSGSSKLFGSRNGNGSKEFIFTAGSLNGAVFTIGYGTNTITATGVDSNTNIHIFKLSKGTGYVDNAIAKQFPQESFTGDYPIYLFGANYAGTENGLSSTRFYYEEIYDGNDALVQNLIPCRRNSDSVLGMYDTVTGNFLTNQGTGTFTAGADVTTPSPDYPMDIISNNGAIKARHQSGLPLGYTLLDYIESSETQYIDTGYKPNANTSINIKYYPAESSAFMCLYGTQDSATSNRFYGLISLTQFRVQINSNAVGTPTFWGLNTDGTFVEGSNGTFAKTQCIVDLTVDNVNKRASIKSDEYTGNISFSGTVLGDNLSCAYNMLLFSRSTGGWAGNNFSGRIYSFSIKDNDTLVQNLVPVRRNSDNVLGMYDLVSGQFLTNAGTGDFTAGSEVSDAIEIYTDGTTEKVEVFGKNLLNSADFITGFGIKTDGTELPSNNSACTPYIKVKPNTKYTLSGVASLLGFYSYRGCEYDNSYTKTQNFGVTNTQYTTLTFTTSATTEYIRITLKCEADQDISQAMLEQGEIATNYEPYFNGGQATAEMLLKVGDYKDTQEVLGGNVTRNVGVKVLDGTEDWKAHVSLAGWFQLSVSGCYGLPIKGYCTHYGYITNAGTVGRYFSTGRLGSYIERIVIADNIMFPSTGMVNKFKRYLSDQYNAGKPVIVVYPLAEPTTESVTGQPLTTQAGTNIVEITQASIDNLGLEVSYKATV